MPDNTWSRSKSVLMLAVGVTLALMWLMWLAQGKLEKYGFNALHWRPIPARFLARAAVFGVLAASAAFWLFRSYARAVPAFQEVWMGITLGPLIEELVFRGYLFWGVHWFLRRFISQSGWLTVVVIAAVFALSHFAKPGITHSQIASVFGTGLLYGWLRLKSDSTVPPVFAHTSYNATIFLAATFL
jgi:membrane protease YdiL (CAAX protease family)